MGDLEEYEEGTQFCVGLARFLVLCTNRAGLNISAFKPLVFRDSFCSRLQSNLAGWHPTESGLSLRLPLYKQGWGLQSPEACAGCPISVPENIKVTIGYHIQNIPCYRRWYLPINCALYWASGWFHKQLNQKHHTHCDKTFITYLPDENKKMNKK